MMYYVKMTLTPLEKTELTEDNVNDADITGNIWGYLGELRRNGQIYEESSLIYSDNTFQAFFFMPELDSLEEKNCNTHVLKSLIKTKKDYEVTFEILGRNAVTSAICLCKCSTWYILYARSIYSFSPIVCGDCLKMLPLYKLPQVELPKDCNSGLGWQADYVLIDKLWFYSDFDRFTYRQMSSLDSQLSKMGREICAAYEKVLDKPVYYFLFHSYLLGGRRPRKKCPGCGDEWVLKEELGNLSFKCEKCRLVSS